MQVSFQANHISKAYYQHQNIFSKNYKKSASNIVEIRSNNDLDKIYVAAKKWQSQYGTCIACNAIINLYNNNDNNTPIRYFVVTQQQKNFKNLKPNLIMGLIELEENQADNSCYIEYLQVKPKNCAYNRNRRNKGFGTSLIEYLKTKYQKISLNSDFDAVKFYQKLGFQKMDKYNTQMIWVIK